MVSSKCLEEAAVQFYSKWWHNTTFIAKISTVASLAAAASMLVLTRSATQWALVLNVEILKHLLISYVILHKQLSVSYIKSHNFSQFFYSNLESTTQCVCQNVSDCPKDSAPLCVTSGDGAAARTMSQCEVGARRCAGEQVSVIDIEACPQWRCLLFRFTQLSQLTWLNCK